MTCSMYAAARSKAAARKSVPPELPSWTPRQINTRPRRYVSTEHLIQRIVGWATQYGTVRAFDYERMSSEHAVQCTRPYEVPDTLLDYLEAKGVVEAAYRPHAHVRWAAWYDIRVMRMTAREAIREHNARLPHPDMPERLAVDERSSQESIRTWARECDGAVEEELRRRGMLVRGAVGVDEYRNEVG